MRKLTLLAKELFMIVVLMRFIDQTVAIIALVGKMRPLLLVKCFLKRVGKPDGRKNLTMKSCVWLQNGSLGLIKGTKRLLI